jgi:hypothetical protein
MRHRCVAVVAASIALFGSMPSNVSAQQAGMPGMPGMGDTTKKSTTKPKAGSKTKKAPSKSRPQAKPQSKPQQADSASSKNGWHADGFNNAANEAERKITRNDVRTTGHTYGPNGIRYNMDTGCTQSSLATHEQRCMGSDGPWFCIRTIRHSERGSR